MVHTKEKPVTITSPAAGLWRTMCFSPCKNIAQHNVRKVSVVAVITITSVSYFPFPPSAVLSSAVSLEQTFRKQLDGSQLQDTTLQSSHTHRNMCCLKKGISRISNRFLRSPIQQHPAQIHWKFLT